MQPELGDDPEARIDTSTERPSAGARLGGMLWELFKTLAIVVVLVVTIRTFVVEAYVIQGASMEPTFHNRERLLISKFAPRFDGLERGDIVIFEHPDDPGKRLIKRIVALPGEAVEIRAGQVYIDGELLDEPYLKGFDGSYYGTHVVGVEHFFVLGDNRSLSNDSRRLGDVPADAVIGRALIRFYPSVRVF